MRFVYVKYHLSLDVGSLVFQAAAAAFDLQQDHITPASQGLYAAMLSWSHVAEQGSSAQ